MKRRIVKVKYYTIHWYLSNGHCYRTTTGCKQEDVANARKTAKILGEKLKVELEEVVEYEY
jgi:hypothetical protein